MRPSRRSSWSIAVISGGALAATLLGLSQAPAATFGGLHGSLHGVGAVGPAQRTVASARLAGPHRDGGRPVTGRGSKGLRVSTGGRSGGDGRNPRPPRHPRWPTHPIGPVVPLLPAVGSAAPLLVNPSLPGGPIVRRGGSGIPPAGERRYVPDEVVLEVAAGLSEQATATLARRHRLARLQSLDVRLGGTRFLRWKITDRRSVPTVVRALEAEGSVLSVQPNYLALLQQDVTEPVPQAEGDPAQYALAKLHLPQAHTLAKGDQVRIAVIDSGIDAAHAELAGVIAESYDPLGPKEPGSAPKAHAHGTGVAGAIVAHAKLMGAAPAAQILAVRAFGVNPGNAKPNGAKPFGAEGTTFNILAGLDWAAAHGARVINMSFAGPQDPAIARSLAAAHGRGIILIAAAGNAGPQSPPLFPASDPNVIAVTATDADDQLFSAANRGSHIAVAAPGVDLLLPAPGGYQLTSGTSFAAAEVSGAVALLLERKPDLDPAAVRRILVETAADLGPRGPDPLFGAGLVDAYRAVASLRPATAAGGAQAAAAAGRDSGQK